MVAGWGQRKGRSSRHHRAAVSRGMDQKDRRAEGAEAALFRKGWGQKGRNSSIHLVVFLGGKRGGSEAQMIQICLK